MTQETSKQETKRDTVGLYRALAIGLLAGAYVWFEFGGVPRAFLALLATMALIAGLEYGWWVRLGDKWPAIYNSLQQVSYWFLGWLPTKAMDLGPYDIIFGWDAKNPRRAVHANLKKLKSFIIVGVTGGGKTSLVHSVLHDIILTLTADQIKLVIFDPKSKRSERGMDFSIYRWLPHLLWPIAKTPDEIKRALACLNNLMDERSKLFELMPERRLVNDMDRYNAVNRSENLGLPELVPVIVILDEIQAIMREHKEAEEIITSVAAEGRAYGIFVIPCTQLPKVEAIPTFVKEQCHGRFSGPMSSARGYSIAEVPKEVYEQHTLREHQFFVRLYSGSEWVVMTANLVPYDDLDAVAREKSAPNLPSWPDGGKLPPSPQLSAPAPEPAEHEPDFQKRGGKFTWPKYGSEDQKVAVLKYYLMRFDEKPTILSTLDDIDWSQRTAETWVPKVWSMLHPD